MVTSIVGKSGIGGICAFVGDSCEIAIDVIGSDKGIVVVEAIYEYADLSGLVVRDVIDCVVDEIYIGALHYSYEPCGAAGRGCAAVALFTGGKDGERKGQCWANTEVFH